MLTNDFPPYCSVSLFPIYNLNSSAIAQWELSFHFIEWRLFSFMNCTSKLIRSITTFVVILSFDTTKCSQPCSGVTQELSQIGDKGETTTKCNMDLEPKAKQNEKKSNGTKTSKIQAAYNLKANKRTPNKISQFSTRNPVSACSSHPLPKHLVYLELYTRSLYTLPGLEAFYC